MKASRIRQTLEKNLLLLTTLAGVIIGIALGIGLRSSDLSDNQKLLIAYPGELFLRMLKLLTLPLLVSSLVTVTASLNSQLGGKIMLRTLVLFALTSFLTASMGISLTFIFRQENVVTAKASNASDAKGSKILDSFLDLGSELVEIGHVIVLVSQWKSVLGCQGFENLFQATFQQVQTVYREQKLENKTNPKLVRDLMYRNSPNTLGLVMFCLIFGTIANSIGEKGDVIRIFFSAVFDILLKITTKVMWLSGIGVCSIIADKLLSVDNLSEVLSQLAVFAFCVILGVFIHQLIILPAIYYIFLRKNPYKFFLSLIDAWVTAFAVASAVVTLPTTMRCMIDKLNHDERIVKFVLSLGIYLNTNGTAMFMAIASVFLAHLNGVTLGYDSLFIVLITSTALSMAMPSIPSASLVMLLIILDSINVDPSNLSLLFGIDWILDRFRTTSNVLDDCLAAAVIEKLSEEELRTMDSKETQSSQQQRPHVTQSDEFV